jgi:2-dehydro-3-deoxyphosphogluconate aldolase/(4S)-4-hydroxy-2-oxoglutarate aldolase
MATFSRLKVLTSLLESGLLPLFYDRDPEAAAGIADACSRGGARVLEFTHRGDHAQDVFADLAVHCAAKCRDLVLGAGSIRDPHTAALYLAAGANFIVGPFFNIEVARLCNAHKVAYLPGCATMTEIGAAEESGCEIIKVFPGECLGPQFIRAVHGPSPMSRLLPTGGVSVTNDSIGGWVGAGAAAVGIGSDLIPSGEKDFERIAERTTQALAIIRQARAQAEGES